MKKIVERMAAAGIEPSGFVNFGELKLAEKILRSRGYEPCDLTPLRTDNPYATPCLALRGGEYENFMYVLFFKKELEEMSHFLIVREMEDGEGGQLFELLAEERGPKWSFVKWGDA